jgi:hypothetical protein
MQLPIISFAIGTLFPNIKIFQKINYFLTIYILFALGLKGGGQLALHQETFSIKFFVLLGLLTLWGFLQPFLSFRLLKRFTTLDTPTAAAVSASFGSVSVMTFVTAVSFLEQKFISYEPYAIVALTLLEIPAILSGIFLGKKEGSPQIGSIIKESLCNKAILSLVGGVIAGLFIDIALPLQPLLCLFLFFMGIQVGQHKGLFKSSLSLFGVLMPLFSGFVGIIISYLCHLDPGTATLIAILTASASYIAVPAAMRLALPEAKEAIYLPLALGITFPFNVIIGIPLFYAIASWACNLRS